MCNLYALKGTHAHIAALFGAGPADGGDLSGEFYPRRQAPVVLANGGERRIVMMPWGFPPPAGAKAPVTNVRNLESPFWKGTLADPARRCLVPASAFCEWEGAAGQKRKRWFTLPSRAVFAFAGLWRPVGESAVFAFLTCEPNPLVAPIHAKSMPVILHEEDHGAWLSTDAPGALALPYPSQLMAVA